ncbi:MAG: ATP-grasp domain-containing protein [Patescibacteria group bacterium]
MDKQKFRIGVIFGGLSEEKEVALASGRHVYQTLDRTLFTPLPIFLDSQARFWKLPESLVIRNTCREVEENLETKGAMRIAYEALAEHIDLAFLTTHGKYGDDGCLQGLLELLKIPYTGSGVLSAALGIDKPMQRKLLAQSEADINLPEHLTFRKEEWQAKKAECIKTLEEKFGYPIVVKPTREGSTLGVMVIKKADDFDSAMNEVLCFDNVALFEPYIKGREFSCVVVGNKEPQAFLPTETIHQGDIFTYDHKYLPGASQKITPMEIDEKTIKEIQRQAVACYQALECKTLARIDGFITEDGQVLITDPNSAASTGMGPSSWTFHQASLAGISPRDFLTKLIELALQAHKQKKGSL